MALISEETHQNLRIIGTVLTVTVAIITLWKYYSDFQERKKANATS